MTEQKLEPYVCSIENAPKITDWLRNRGGILVWKSVNLANPHGSWVTPAINEKGDPSTKPTWEAVNAAERHITSMDDVVVVVPEEVKRFHVAIREGSQGLSVKVTDGGTRRIWKEIAKAKEKYGRDAWYAFDYYDHNNAVIFVDSDPTPFRDWLIQHLYGVVDELQEQLKNARQVPTPQTVTGSCPP